ncbi:hypothetical protein TNCV_2908891 [Trichonephila clavipes]|nr:hypothetical protein TNCV_2908891 [Trichonephila clavipes]
MDIALKLPNQAPRGSGKSLQKCVAWRCLDGTQRLFCWPILAISGQSLASNGPGVDSRDLNLVFGHAEATPNKLFLSSPTKYAVETSWSLVLVLQPFELLHPASHNIVVCDPFLILLHHPLKKWVNFSPFGQGFADGNLIHHVFLVLIGVAPKHVASL